MAKNRARDARRVAKSIRTHEKTMAAYGSAVVSNMKDPAHFVKPTSVMISGSRESKIAKQRSKGLVTDREANDERFEAGIKSYVDEGKETFHKGLLKPAAQYKKEKENS
jgi:hypothetical protein